MSKNWLEKYRLTIKRPSGTNKSFDLILDIKSDSGRTQRSIKTYPEYTKQADSLRALNQSLKLGMLSDNDVEVDIKTNLIPSIESQLNKGKTAIRDSVTRKANGSILDKLWDENYEYKKLIDKNRTRNAFERALDCLDSVSLSSATQSALQKAWDRHPDLVSGTAHRRYGRCVNALLKYIGRPIRLQLAHNEHREMRYPTLDEMFRIVSFYDNDKDLQNLIVTMFCTGVREGEAFALNSKSLRNNNNVYVEAQIDRSFVRRQIKNRNKHNAIIIPEGLDHIKRWLALPQDEKNLYRKLVSNRIADASMAVLERRISSHDMRHGYAVHLIDKGVSLDRLAQFLGDTIEVTQKHYASFVASDFAIETISKLLKA